METYPLIFALSVVVGAVIYKTVLLIKSAIAHRKDLARNKAFRQSVQDGINALERRLKE